MTITTTSNKVVCLGNGATIVFDYMFLIPSAGEVVVIYTDASGDQSVIANGNYAITGLGNAAGGTVQYPLAGSAIASGTTLTIERVLPVVQNTSLSNQGNFYPDVIEAGLDYITMVAQQIAGVQGLAIQAPVTDAKNPTPLPPAAQRALQYLGFDADGNPIAAQGVGAGATVSSAMQPVVAAASIAAALALLGFGSADAPSLAGLDLTAAAGVARLLAVQTAGVDRWSLGGDTAAESGNNAGTNLALSSYNDDGSLLTALLSIVRSTGTLTYAGSVSLASTLGVAGQISQGGSPLMPIGAIVAFAALTSPGGYLECDGAAISRTTYAALFAVCGTTFGAGDGSTTFNKPDLRGEFVRGYDDGRGKDPDRVFGSTQTDAFQGHVHSSTSGDFIETTPNGTNIGSQAGTAFGRVSATGVPATDGADGVPRTAAETRPVNVALLYCIKF